MLSRKMQSGRSMIEMLGVLGIMAVITVLGISVYAIATRSIKMNKLKSEVAIIAQQVRSMTQPFDYSSWGSVKTYQNSFVDTGLMKSYNALGVGSIRGGLGYSISGISNVGFGIDILFSTKEDCALVNSIDWNNADGVFDLNSRWTNPINCDSRTLEGASIFFSQ